MNNTTLTLKDFQSDFQHMVVRGISKDVEHVRGHVDEYFSHIKKECKQWLSKKGVKI